MIRLLFISVVLFIFYGCQPSKDVTYDVCVYGGTSAGVIAAYSAKMLNKKVILIEPTNRLGGLSSGGLGYTDIGNKQVVTGLSKDFYRKVGAHYGKLEQWIFEPSVAKKIFEEYIQQADVEVLYDFQITDASVRNKSIRSITLQNTKDEKGTKKIAAKMFIDCTYEGDLMAKAGVSYTTGREDNSLYGETYNGVQLMHRHQFPDFIDPYKIKGDSTSGLLWGISDDILAENGTGDKLIQAYNYRICLTNDPMNRKEITEPEDYNPAKYELLLRLFDIQPEKRKLNDYFIWSKMPNNKTDINNRGGFSTDMIGMNHNYPEGSYAERKEIINNHRTYTQGLLYFIKTDPRVPKELQNEIQEWGYPLDEYTESDNWSPQLYIREARRLVGEYVMTQAHCEHKEVVEDGIGMAAYTMDSHNCQRIVIQKDGVKMVKNEGNVEIGGGLPYPISYKSIIPKKEECKNLLVPVCLSASHIAFGSIRMEPVFMVLAQSAAVAAVEALKTGDVHRVDINNLQKILKVNPLLDNSKPEILIDNSSLSAPSGWNVIKKPGGYGVTYVETNADNPTPFRINMKEVDKGTYKVYSYYQKGKDVVDNVNYTFYDGQKSHTTSINKNEIEIVGQTTGDWILLGNYMVGNNQDAYFEIHSNDKKGKIIADALLLIPSE